MAAAQIWSVCANLWKAGAVLEPELEFLGWRWRHTSMELDYQCGPISVLDWLPPTMSVLVRLGFQDSTLSFVQVEPWWRNNRPFYAEISRSSVSVWSLITHRLCFFSSGFSLFVRHRRVVQAVNNLWVSQPQVSHPPHSPVCSTVNQFYLFFLRRERHWNDFISDQYIHFNLVILFLCRPHLCLPFIIFGTPKK